MAIRPISHRLYGRCLYKQRVCVCVCVGTERVICLAVCAVVWFYLFFLDTKIRLL